VQDFRKLVVWQKSHDLVVTIYRVTRHFPPDELYGLAGQMRRAATSIPSNIAEGCGRGGKGELTRFLQIASGSASELEYQLFLAHEIGYLQVQDHSASAAALNEIQRMLRSLAQTIKSTKD